MDIWNNHINIPPNYLFLISFISPLPLALPLCLSRPDSSCCLSPQLLQSQCSYIRLSVLITVLLIIVHQIIIQNFHSDEVRGVIHCGTVKAATSHLYSCQWVRAAKGMWEHHAEVLLWLTFYDSTPICSSICLFDHSNNSEPENYLNCEKVHICRKNATLHFSIYLTNNLS